MVIVNATRGTVLARHIDVAASFWARGRGLIGQPELPPDGALVLRPSVSVHALFLSFPIDVIFLDRNDYVLWCLTPLKPWHIGPVVWRIRTVIEVPAGTMTRSGTVAGDRIEWQELGDEDL